MVKMKIIKQYHHKKANNCVMGSFRDICEFNGYDFSEDFLLGICGGLCFVYLKFRRFGMPAFTTGANIRTFLDDICSLLNINYETRITKSSRRAWDSVKELIDLDIPVALQVEMCYLPYFEEIKVNGAPKEVDTSEAHFGGHMVVVIGYDDENEHAYIYDNGLEEMQIISYEDLQRARTSKLKPFPPNNRIWKFIFPKTLPQFDEIIRNSFKKTIANFYEGPGFTGIRSERKLANEIVKWPEMFNKEELTNALWLGIYVFGFALSGTGGGMFREAYSRFLVQVSEILKEEKLREIAKIFSNASDNWASIAYIAKEAIEIKDKNELEKALKIASDKILETSYLEENALSRLKEFT